MWRKLPELTKGDSRNLQGLKKAKLYADEVIEEDAVEFLRDSGVNITSAREMGLQGKPDGFHAALAYREKRFLLTKNAKHFMDDKIVPFQMVHGIIVIDGDMGNMESYTKALLGVLSLVPYGEVYFGMKIRISNDETYVRFIAANGKMTVARIKMIGNDIYEWVDHE